MENTNFSDPKDKTVLVVDDDESIRDLLDFTLRREGFKVEKAEEGEAALAKAKALHPDIILLDLMLPKFGGFEILRELQNDETSDIPIVVVTGRYTDRSTAEMIKQEPNVKDFVEKPVKPQVLISIVHTLLKTRPIPKKPGA
jgi:two-component system alkaline phosphatase synthesis response regulator PhoP